MCRPAGTSRTVFGLLVATCALACALLGACAGSSIPVREHVEAYSWDELSAISNEISAADDDQAALEVAKRYHLVNADGKLDASKSKELVLSDGTKTSALIAGFRQDTAASGQKAGITFIFANAVGSRAMNANGGLDELSKRDYIEAFGGWVASDMRAWLNGDLFDSLPADLRAVVIPAVKTSRVITLEVAEGLATTQSVDKIWLPALSEVADAENEITVSADYGDLSTSLQSEGACYQLFSDAKEMDGSIVQSRMRTLANAEGSGAACKWWLRSVGKTMFADVRDDGAIASLEDPETVDALPQGVVPCFAL